MHFSRGTPPAALAALVLTGACSHPVKATPTSCTIDARSYAARQTNPDNPCQLCEPELTADQWSNQPAGTLCAGGSCELGGCQMGCTIGGLFFLTGAQNPKNPCEACEPQRDGASWTPQSGAAPGGACGAGGVCANGACAVGCFVDGQLTADGTFNPLDSCQICRVGNDPAGWSAVPSGTPCADGGGLCVAGRCSVGCLIGGSEIADGVVNPVNGCEVCAMSHDPSGWSSVPAGTPCADGGGICGDGICVYGCEIGGVLFPATTHDPSNACQICNPASSGSTWSPWSGLPPDGCAGGQACNAGTCQQGCFIDDAFITNRSYAARKDLCCNTADPGSWSSSFVQGDQYPSFDLTTAAVGDFNGDGIPDVALSSQSYGLLVVFLGQGGGAFSSQEVLSSSTPQGAALLATADMNGDGNADLVALTYAGYYTGQSISVFLNLGGDAGFAAETDTPSSVPVNTPSFVVADVNNDNRPDVIYANSDSAGSVSFLRNNGDGTLSAQPQFSAGAAYVTSVQAADFNGDGFIDLVALANDPTGAQVNVLLNDRTGHFPTWTTAASFPPYSISNLTPMQPCSAAVADLNGDGFNDIVVLGYSSLIVLSGRADGGFDQSPRYNIGASDFCGSVATADFDGDGHPDVLVTAPTFNGETLYVGLLRNSGNGVLEAAFPLFVPTTTTSSVTVADMNQDQALDLMVIDRLSWSIRFNGCPP